MRAHAAKSALVATSALLSDKRWMAVAGVLDWRDAARQKSYAEAARL
jgi:hypothetical protein